MARLAFIATYLAGAAAAVILLNANIGAGELALAIWAIVSVLLGWGTGRPAFAPLAFLAIPFAVPFGYPDHYEFSEPLPIWWSVAVCAFFSAGLILLSAFLKLIVEARRHRKAPPERGFSRSG
jgi:hypothetical protein